MPQPPDNGPGISDTMKHILLGIAGACLVLVFLSLNPLSGSGSDNNDDYFLISHTLDPNNPIDYTYTSWEHPAWMDWLERRDALLTEARRRKIKNFDESKNRLNKKPINTVVIATPQQITDTFKGNLVKFGSEMVWSNDLFPTNLFVKKNDGSYEIYRCPPTYIAVRLDDVKKKPFHLATYNTVKIQNGNSNYDFKKNCVPLEKE